jgi:hypothetical protein
MLVFDLETDGLLPEVSVVHTLSTYDTETRVSTTYDLKEVRKGIDIVMSAPSIVGHNIIMYDLPVIKKLYGLEPKGRVRDTIVLARLAYSEIKDVDFALARDGKLPGKLIGSHSLKAWGHRLGEYKGDYTGGWEKWSQEMSDYCKQDIVVTTCLLQRINAKELPEAAIELEHQVQHIIYRQQSYGFLFDKDKAEKLYSTLLKRQKELGLKLAEFFPPWTKEEVFIPKRGNKTRGYVAGVPFTKVKIIEFNPASRTHIAQRLTAMYGWKPKQEDFTDDGTPKLDEEILKALPYPEAPYLAEYFLILKRIGQLAEGKEAWLKNIEKDGRIHGSVNSIGAVTRRMTHAHPNVAQTPRVGTPYGAECRDLFGVPDGRSLVGADASGLELRCLAHYLAAHDNGAYVRTVVEGNRDDETDVHSITCKAIGLNPKTIYTFGLMTATGRDFGKRFIYAFLYGAGNLKLGSILGKGAAAGAQMKTDFMAKIPGLSVLKTAVENAARANGILRSLDGMPMKVRSQHAALNTLLQGAGALVMKKALVLLDQQLQMHYQLGVDYEFVANIHDEWQIECKTEHATAVGELAKFSFVLAGKALNLRCPLAGEYKIGKTWAETH